MTINHSRFTVTKSRVTMWEIHTCNYVTEMLMFVWEKRKSQENRPTGQQDRVYTKGPRSVKNLLEILWEAIGSKDGRIFTKRPLSSGRQKLLWNLLSWVEKINDFNLKAEFTIITDLCKIKEWIIHKWFWISWYLILLRKRKIKKVTK